MDPGELLDTNPVFALDQLAPEKPTLLQWVAQQGQLDAQVAALQKQGHELPPAALGRWVHEGRLSRHFLDVQPEEPWVGVYGLVVSPWAGDGFVVPIEGKPATTWSVEPPLPARTEQVLDLVRLICRAGAGADPTSVSRYAFPEAFGVRLFTRFPLPADGGSMDVALALAALFALADQQAPHGVCAIVQRKGNALRPVGDLDRKLAAFSREVGRGELLVRSSHGPEAGLYDSQFDEVWVVDTIADLARHLVEADWLAKFAEPTPLSVQHGNLLLARLENLAEVDFRHAEVVDLAERLLAATWEDSVPQRQRLASRQYLPASLRHLGRYGEAYGKAVSWESFVRSSELFSCEDQARAALEVAASLFDPGREEEALQCLQPWLQRIEAEPRLLSPQTRVRIWNTVARALSLLTRPGWDAWFGRSMDLQERDDPAGVGRTRNYFVHACLRAGELDRAEELLAAASDVEAGDPAWRGFLRADLARRRGEEWCDEELDRREPQPGQANHALGYYHQAVARQSIDTKEAARRFDMAARCFRHDLEGCDRANVLWILMYAMELAGSVAAGGADGATQAARALRDSVTQPDLESFHAKVAAVLPKDGDSELEPLLRELPWL